MEYIEPQPSRTWIDFAALRSEISIGQVLDLFGWHPVSSSDEQLRGPCPIHKSTSDRSRSFSVHLEKNAYQCFGCGSKGNQLDLAVAVFGTEVYTTARELCDRLGVDLPTRDNAGR